MEYLRDFVRIYIWKVFKFLNRHLLKTYLLIEDCARCRDCGRNVHDFGVPNWLWIKVWGNESGILCYDCFCDRLDRQEFYKHRMTLKVVKWN